ncbi:MAG: hypothetical protein RLZZ437_1497 [Pseudomonadota bacterium]|jgi:hypothetical protein
MVRGAAIMGLTGLAACVASAPPTPVARAIATEAVPVTYRDRAFVASIAPGAPGVTLTRAGAVPVAGATVRVTAPGLARDEGIAAKEAARLACEGQGGAFQGQAIGSYAGPETWAFAGACA